jgi:hypothetical protein
VIGNEEDLLLIEAASLSAAVWIAPVLGVPFSAPGGKKKIIHDF